MNQILSVDPPQNKKGKSNKSSIHSIVVVFAIILILFGIGLTSTGAYSYYKNITSGGNDQNTAGTNTKPVITIQRENASTITIVVTHDKGIANITYTINDQEQVTIQGNNQTYVEEKVELPVGSSTIIITAEDENGISSSYSSSFEVGQRPTITLEQVDGKIQATTESEITIAYILYYWDEDQANAQRIEINNVSDVRQIDVLEGNHTLTIVAVDTEGNETTKTQKIIGDNKPTLDITTNGEIFLIKAADDEGLAKIEITLNTNDTITEQIDNNTEYSTTVNLEDGENRLTVVIYNINGLTETARVKYTKE